MEHKATSYLQTCSSYSASHFRNFVILFALVKKVANTLISSLDLMFHKQPSSKLGHLCLQNTFRSSLTSIFCFLHHLRLVHGNDLLTGFPVPSHHRLFETQQTDPLKVEIRSYNFFLQNLLVTSQSSQSKSQSLLIVCNTFFLSVDLNSGCVLNFWM